HAALAARPAKVSALETSSGFIIERRDLGGPRSQRGVRKISLEVFFRTDVIDGHSLLSDPNPNSISIPLSAQREKARCCLGLNHRRPTARARRRRARFRAS